MTTQQVLSDENATPSFLAADIPGIFLPSSFKLQAADKNLVQDPDLLRKQAPPGLTPQQKFGDALVAFDGPFTGPGFNTIFRPNSQITPTPNVPGDPEVLELNLTHEMWNFERKDLGNIPNRGLAQQKDIDLFGRVYTQTVLDITDINGKRLTVDRAGKLVDERGQAVDVNAPNVRKPREIHFEPGIFLSIPPTDNPGNGATITRMASIPHGTTINAQGLQAITFPGGPQIKPVSITPFVIGNEARKVPNENGFASQALGDPKTARLPQDLTAFKAAGTITEAILKDPNQLLVEHNKNKQFGQTSVFTVSSTLLDKQFNPQRAAIESLQKIAEFLKTNPGGPVTATELLQQATELEQSTNTSNIAFLDGSKPSSNKQIASAAKVTATFWVSTVNYQLKVEKDWRPTLFNGVKDVLRVTPSGFAPGTVPTFAFPTGRPIRAQSLTVPAFQIQYSQLVLLNFNGLSWPHVSVATIVPLEDIQVPVNLVAN